MKYIVYAKPVCLYQEVDVDNPDDAVPIARATPNNWVIPGSSNWTFSVAHRNPGVLRPQLVLTWY